MPKRQNTKDCSKPTKLPLSFFACPNGDCADFNRFDAGTVSTTAGNTIMQEMAKTGKKPEIIAEELNLIQKSDAGELETIVDQVLAENPRAVNDVKSGGKKSKAARGFLLGQVMQKTKGAADPKVVSEILAKKLG